jgi:hypothetical protein
MKSRLLIAMSCLLVLASAVRASAPDLGTSPEQQKKYDEAMQSARSSQSVAEWCIRAGIVLIAIGCFYAAYSTVRHGFSITKTNKIEGTGAWVIAVLVALVGVAILVDGWIYAGSILP